MDCNNTRVTLSMEMELPIRPAGAQISNVVSEFESSSEMTALYTSISGLQVMTVDDNYFETTAPNVV